VPKHQLERPHSGALVSWRKELLLNRSALVPAWEAAFPQHDLSTGRFKTTSRCSTDTFEQTCAEAEAAKQPADAATRRQHGLLANDVSFEAAYRAINDPRDRATPQSVVEAVIVSVIERGLGALEEPKNLDRLGRCDAQARAEVGRRVAKLEAEGRLGIGLAPPEMGRFRSKSGSSK
jgi:hypothetical protein